MGQLVAQIVIKNNVSKSDSEFGVDYTTAVLEDWKGGIIAVVGGGHH